MVSMANPLRMLEGSEKSSFVVKSKDGAGILKTSPISFATNMN